MNSVLKVILLSFILTACASLPAGSKARLGSTSNGHALIYLLNNIGGVNDGWRINGRKWCAGWNS